MGAAAKKIDKKPVYEQLSTMQIGMRFGLTRETVRQRLFDAGIEPVIDEPKKKIYELTPDAIAAITKPNSTLDAAKLRHEEARAKLAEVKVEQITGEVVKMNDAREVFATITAKMYGELATQMPKRLAGRLAKARSAAETAKIVRNEVERVFQMLRNDPESMLK